MNSVLQSRRAEREDWMVSSVPLDGWVKQPGVQIQDRCLIFGENDFVLEKCA